MTDWLPVLVTSLFVIVILLVPNINGADPVYSPQTVTDESGNSADNSSTISWASLPSGAPFKAGNTERVSEGLKAYYDFVHNFINSVFMKGIPDEIIEKGIQGDLGSIVDNYQSYINYFIGYAICVVIGVLFLLIFPIVACCFCCCRLCGNCGGEKQQLQKNADNVCRKYSFTCVLFISTTFVMVGTICIYVNNDNMTTTLNNIPETAEDNINDIRTFVNNTVNEAQHIVTNNFQFVQTALFRDLDNIDYLVGLPLKTDIEDNTNITTILSSAHSLANVLDEADAALSSVEANKTALETAVTDLQSAISTVTTNLDNAFAACGGGCPTTNKPDYSSASSDIDTSAFPDISGARTSMDSAKGTNMTEQIDIANDEIEDIPDRVQRDSNDTIVDLKSTISDLSDDLKDVESEITDINSQISGENATIDLDKLILDIKDYKELLEQYDKYRWYGGVGLASICLVVIIFAVLGTVFGILGTDVSTPPHRRSCVSDFGGIMLMVSASLIFIFSALLMLLTFFTFIPGAPIHKVFCEPVTNLDELERYMTIYSDEKVGKGKYFLADVILDNDTIPLQLTGALKACKAGEGAFSAFKLDSKFDLTDMLNYSKVIIDNSRSSSEWYIVSAREWIRERTRTTLDVQAELDKVNVNLSSVEVYSSSLQTQLTDLKDAVNISFTDFYSELNSNITTVNLSSLAQELDDYASSLGDPTAKAAIEAEATELRSIEAEEYAYVESNKTALNTSVAEMDSVVSNIPTLVDDLDSDLQKADTYIKNNASTVVRSILNTYVNRLLSIIDSYVAYTDDAVKNKLGSCEPVWNIYNSLLVYTFCYNFMDCFNGFWFSLGWVIFFFMVSVIFSVKLAKYFRRMDYPDDDSLLLSDSPSPYPTHGEKDPNPPPVFSQPAMPSKVQFWMKHNRVAHRDSDDCTSVSSPAPPPFPSSESNTDFLAQVPQNLYDDCTVAVHDDTTCNLDPLTDTPTNTSSFKKPKLDPESTSCTNEGLHEPTKNAEKETNDTFPIVMDIPIMIKENSLMSGKVQNVPTNSENDDPLCDSNGTPDSEEKYVHQNDDKEENLSVDCPAKLAVIIGPGHLLLGSQNEPNIKSQKEVSATMDNAAENIADEIYVNEKSEQAMTNNNMHADTNYSELFGPKATDPDKDIECQEKTQESAVTTSKNETLKDSDETRSDSLTPVG